MQPIQCYLLLSALYMFWRFFHPSSGAYKAVCSDLGIVPAFLLSAAGVDGSELFRLIYTSGRQQERMTIAKAARIVL
jgi:hypothetical protein